MSKEWNIPMILHDWQAGKTSTDIAKVYGFSSARACRDRIAKWRKQGWNFEKRTAGCSRKNKRTLTQSEEITAGAIRQAAACRRCHGKGYTVTERNGEEGEIRCEACRGDGVMK